MYNFTTPAAMFAELCLDRINTVVAGSVFVGTMPEEPNECIVFYDTGGEEQYDRIALDEYKVQIRARGSYAETYALLQDVKRQLQSIPRFTLNDGTVVVGIWSKSNTAFMGRDDQERAMFSVNFKLKTTPADIGHRNFPAT